MNDPCCLEGNRGQDATVPGACNGHPVTAPVPLPVPLPVTVAAARRFPPPLVIVAMLAFVVGIVGRLATFAGQPLWFDETFTGVIATQPDLPHFYRWVVMELGGPVYYGLVWLWQSVAGASNASLRFPSLLFSVATLFIAARNRVLDQSVRMVLVALLSLAMTGYLQSAEARSYALLTLVALVQALAFLALLREPVLRKAAIWVGLSCLAILIHYHAAVVSLMQGLLYLGYRRRRALETWPALFALLPAIVWGDLQFAFLSAYAAPGSNWYVVLPASALWLLLPATIPFGILAYVLCILSLWPLARNLLARLRQGPARAGVPSGAVGPDRDAAPGLTALSGVLAALLIVLVGMIVPSFTVRYLVPATPAILLGMALGLAALHRVRPLIVEAALLLLTVFSAVFWMRLMHYNGTLKPLNFEPASAWVMANGDPRRVVFFWDNPTGDISGEDHLAEVGNFFFTREGRPMQIAIPRGMGRDADPNGPLRQLAGPGGAVIWLVDKNVPGTRAVRHPETFTSDPAWHCRKFGKDRLHVLACLPSN